MPRRAARSSATAGGGFLGGVNQGEIYVRIAPHEERHALARRLLERDAQGQPAGRLPRQLLAARRDAARSAGGCAKFTRPAASQSATSRRSTSAAATSTSTSSSAGPSSSRSPSTASELRDRDRARSAASSTPTPRCELDKPELRVDIDRERAADLGVDAARHRHGAAPDGRRRRGGQPLPRPARQRGLRRPAPPDRGRPQRPRPRSSSSTSRAAAAGSSSCGTSRRSSRSTAASRIDRLDRQREVRLRGRRRARATRWPTASRPSAQAAAEMNLPPATPIAISRQRPRAGAHVHRVPLGVPALGRLHVHDPGDELREPGPPVHDPALAAADRPVRAAVALAHRRHAQPLLRPGHPRAVRRGEEELDPPDRPHEPPARTRACRASTRSSRATATGCARSS